MFNDIDFTGVFLAVTSIAAMVLSCVGAFLILGAQ